MSPKISIMMPSYNHSRWVIKAVNSVLNQTYQDWELIICDDISKDDSFEKLTEFCNGLGDSRIRLSQNEENLGEAKIRDKMLRMATGAYITHLDSDDTFKPHALQVMADTFARFPNLGLAYSDYDHIDEYGRFVSYGVNPDFSQANVIQLGWRHMGCYSIEKALEVGGFNTVLKTCSDGDLFMKFVEKYSVVRVPEVLYSHRTHGFNTQNTHVPCAECPHNARNECNFIRVHNAYNNLRD